MNKIGFIIIAIAAICLISSGVAVFLGYDNIDDIGAIAKTNDITQEINKANNDSLSNIEETNEENNKENIAGEDTAMKEFIPGTKAFIPYVLNYDHSSPEHPETYLLDLPVSRIFLSYGIDYTDRYGFCYECYKYRILGPITKPLPDTIQYCDGMCDVVSNANERNTYSYEEIIENPINITGPIVEEPIKEPNPNNSNEVSQPSDNVDPVIIPDDNTLKIKIPYHVA